MSQTPTTNPCSARLAWAARQVVADRGADALRSPALRAMLIDTAGAGTRPCLHDLDVLVAAAIAIGPWRGTSLDGAEHESIIEGLAARTSSLADTARWATTTWCATLGIPIAAVPARTAAAFDHGEDGPAPAAPKPADRRAPAAAGIVLLLAVAVVAFVLTRPGGGSPSHGAPTTGDLEALLPTASEIGDGWTVTEVRPDDEDTKAFQAAVAEQCPALVELGVEGDEADEAAVSFGNDLAQSLDVALSPSAEAHDPDDHAALIEEANSCGSVSSTDRTGFTSTVEFLVEEYDALGDQGILAQAHLTLDAELSSTELDLVVLHYRSGTIDVTVQGADGVTSGVANVQVTPHEETDLQVTPLDQRLVISVGEALAPEVGELSAD